MTNARQNQFIIYNNNQEIKYHFALVNGLPFYKDVDSNLWRSTSGFSSLDANPELQCTGSEALSSWASTIAQSIENDANTQGALTVFFPLFEGVNSENYHKHVGDFISSFGSVEALLISMKVSEIWDTNIVCQKIKARVLENSSCKEFFDSNDFAVDLKIQPNYLTLRGELRDREMVYGEANQWIKGGVAAERNYALFVYKKNSNSNSSSKLIPGGLLAVAALAGTTGGLILGNILNIGLLSGTGGLILAGLSTAAAATGFGLLALSAVLLVGLMGFAAYKSYQSCKRNKNLPESFDKVDYTENSAATRTRIIQSLSGNDGKKLSKISEMSESNSKPEEKGSVPDGTDGNFLASAKDSATSTVSNKPSFFSKACRRVFGGCMKTPGEEDAHVNTASV